MIGTDFTDCPYTALQYARGRRGVLLVVDVPDDGPRVTEELWSGTGAKRLMLWGRFDGLIVARIAAKELRAHVRKKGVVTADDNYKAMVLRRAVAEWMKNGGS